MRDHRPPERIAPVKFASSKASFSGVFPVTYFERLSDLLASNDGDIFCTLEGIVDEANRSLLKAHIKAQVALQCQTCFAPMPFAIDQAFTLCVVKDDEEASNVTEYEPLILDREELLVRDIFEDELILSLPVVANHEPEDCIVDVKILRQHDEIDVSEKPNPFSVLVDLKKPSK